MGAFQPSDDETHDLGTTSARWQNVHADKLVISGAANDASTLTSTLGGHLTIGGAGENQILNIASHDTVDGGLQLAGTLVTASAAELNFVDGVTSAIQTQLDAKAALASPALTGTATAVNLTVSGTLTVNGTTTTVNSTTVTIDDPIFTLGGDTAPGSDDNKDRGIEFRYFDTEARIGFMGWDDSASGFTLLSAATNTAEVFAGTAAPLVIGGLTTTGITLGGTTVTSITAAGKALLDDADAAAQRTTLGLAIGSDVQGFDAQLSDVAGLTPSDGNFIVGDGNNFTVESGATARASLGLAIGSNVQAHDTQLDTLAGFTAAQVTRGIADDNLLTIDDADAAQNDYVRLTASGAEGRSFAEVRSDLGLGSLATASDISNDNWSGTDLAITNGGTGASSASDARTNLGLAIGSDVQAFNADLTAIAGLTSAANKGIQFTGDGTAATYDLTAAGKALLDDADAAAQRTTLGIATNSDVVFNSVTANGGLVADNLTLDGTSLALSSGDFTLDVAGDITLDADDGIITLSDGGTSRLSFNIADGAGVSITSTQNGDDVRFVTETAEIMRLDSSASSLLINGTKKIEFGDTGSFIHQSADGKLKFSSDGAAADAIIIAASDNAGGIDIDAGTGGISIDSEGASSFGVASAADADDLTIAVTNATDSSLFLTSAGTGSDALEIDATAGSMTIGKSLADGQTLKVGKTGTVQMTFSPHGTAGNEKWSLINTAGTADGTNANAAAVQLTSTAGGLGLAWADDKDLWAEGGRAVITANEDAASAIKLHADAGTSQTIQLLNDAGTSSSAIDLTASAGGFSIDGVQASNIGVAAAGAGDDLTIAVTGTSDASLFLTSAGTGSDALEIDATAGSMTIGKSLADGQTLKVGKTGTVQMSFEPSNTAGSEKWSLINTGGDTDGSDAAGAILLSSVAGGIGLAWADDKDLWAEGGRAVITANEDAADAIKLHADAGTSQTITLLNDQGTDAAAIGLTASAGGITLTSSTTTVTGNLKLSGNIIKDSSGQNQFVFSTHNGGSVGIGSSPNGTLSTAASNSLDVDGELLIGGNKIRNSEAEVTITMDTDQKVGIGGIDPSHMLDVNGDIRVRGNDIRNSEGEATISMDADQHVTMAANLTVSGKAILGASTELQIDENGAITVTKSYHKIATNTGNNDNLDTINGGVAGMIVILQATNDTDQVTLRDDEGNLKLAGACTLGHSSDTVQLIYNGTNWCEISRSDNS